MIHDLQTPRPPLHSWPHAQRSLVRGCKGLAGCASNPKAGGGRRGGQRWHRVCAIGQEEARLGKRVGVRVAEIAAADVRLIQLEPVVLSSNFSRKSTVRALQGPLTKGGMLIIVTALVGKVVSTPSGHAVPLTIRTKERALVAVVVQAGIDGR